MKMGSMAGFIEGKDADIGIPNVITAEDATIGTTETPIFSLHNHDTYQSKVNRVNLEPRIFTASVDASTNKPATLRIRLNPALTGASFSTVDANTSVARTDTAATAVSGGTVVFADSITVGSTLLIDLKSYVEKLLPTDTLTVSLEASAGTVDSVVALNWRELF